MGLSGSAWDADLRCGPFKIGSQRSSFRLTWNPAVPGVDSVLVWVKLGLKDSLPLQRTFANIKQVYWTSYFRVKALWCYGTKRKKIQIGSSTITFDKLHFYVILDVKRVLNVSRVVCLTKLFPKFASAGREECLAACCSSLQGNAPLLEKNVPIWRGQQPLFWVICYNDDDFCWIVIVVQWQNYS